MQKKVIVRGAREHNLKNIDVVFPRNKLVVITGLSGSGKSSLAFDTIYAEGQRRYIESMSSYARQFLEKIRRPDVDKVEGLSPSLSIEQKPTGYNPRSTVATLTEIFDFLRLLFSKVGKVHCYQCGSPIVPRSVKGIITQIMAVGQGAETVIMAPIVRGRKGEYRKLIEDVRKKGFSKIRIDGKVYDLYEEISLKKTKRHDIDVVVDRLKIESRYLKRIQNAIEITLKLANGTCLISYKVKKGKSMRWQDLFFSEKMACLKCNISFDEFTPNMFSFNSPYGACKRCRGIGKVSQIISDLVVKNPSKPLLKGALNKDIYFSFNKYFIQDLAWELKQYYKIDLNIPFEDLPEEARDAFFWGNEDFPGLFDELSQLARRTSSETMKRKIRIFLKEDICPECGGGRIRKESLGVTVGRKNIVEIAALSVEEANRFFSDYKPQKKHENIGGPILKEVNGRLKFLLDVGLGYLTLDRAVNTLAGGELQRIRLAAQLGVGLSGVLYVLDEPSIGLHASDNTKLLNTLKNLRDMRNTILVVEHDEATMREADHLIDLGPGAGNAGGRVVASGSFREVSLHPTSLTAKYLKDELKIAVPGKRKRPARGKRLKIKGASEFNLKNINVDIPLGLFVCVTGVSGSGKSTLIEEILFKALHNKLWKTDYKVGKHKKIENTGLVDKVVEIDQTPIGRTPRSNPATYTDIFGHIRKLFAQMPEAKLRNYSPARFSFNLKGGRCETCQGEGYQKLEMSFLPDLYVLCDSCNGKRYNEQTLQIKYRDKNISDVLDMSISEACEFFSNIPVLSDKLQLMREIGLGYLKLGQPSPNLSGGEAQRIKLISELSKRATGKTVYILDEPTTGLHFADIDRLLGALFKLRDSGNTVIVIEHNLDVIKTADYVIDLGPEGGKGGGRLVAKGTPEDIVKEKKSFTGQFLKKYLR